MIGRRQSFSLSYQSEVLGMDSFDKTMKFTFQEETQSVQVTDVLLTVYDALQEKGYNPINQIVGYLLSGDPAYIPRHKDARSIIRKLERDELIEELVKSYLKQHRED
ncbi:IreB family regulatory phosphoprotein [Ectobacillus funiculus]